jgi:hypothetical protein
MNERKKFEEFMLGSPEEDEGEISDTEILMEGEEEKEPEQIEKDDEKLDELMMLQEFDEEKNPIKYDSVEDKYEEQLLLDHVEKMVSKYMERERRP